MGATAGTKAGARYLSAAFSLEPKDTALVPFLVHRSDEEIGALDDRPHASPRTAVAAARVHARREDPPPCTIRQRRDIARHTNFRSLSRKRTLRKNRAFARIEFEPYKRLSLCSSQAALHRNSIERLRINRQAPMRNAVTNDAGGPAWLRPLRVRKGHGIQSQSVSDGRLGNLRARPPIPRHRSVHAEPRVCAVPREAVPRK